MNTDITKQLFILVLAFSLSLTCDSTAQQHNVEAQQQKIIFQRATGIPDESRPNYFQFVIGALQYKIALDGSGTRWDSSAHSLTFNLNLLKKEYEEIDTFLYYAEFKNDILVLCVITLDDAGAGIIARFDGKSLRLKWKQRINAFNIGPAIIEGNYAYVTAIGLISKIDLTTGKYVWLHEGLYRKDGSFNSFELPEITEKRILFKENHYKPKTIEVNKSSGKILKISPK